LRIRWAAFLITSLCFLGAGYIILSAVWTPVFAQRWLVITSVVSLYLAFLLWSSLEHNHRSEESRLLPSFGIGTDITLGRGLLLAGLAGFLSSPPPDGFTAWLPGLLYLAAGVLDYLDGYLARRADQVTILGGILDIRLDSLGVFAAVLLAVQYGQLPYWYLLVAFARYIYLFGLWLWKRAGFEVHELPPSASRRFFAGMQMGFLTILLLPLFSPPGTHIAALLFALPFLVGFTRDWLYAAGILIPSERSGAGFIFKFNQWAPVFIQLAVSMTIILLVSRSIGNLSNLSIPMSLMVLVNLAAALAIAFGIAGRLFAVIGLCMLGFAQFYSPLTPIQILLAAGYVALIYLGTGPFSLWKPEDQVIFGRRGAPQAKPVQAEPL
jgi:CDP-diacylglycerol--glycerol-3-phosphate 3-phosphatidyltransferase